MNYTQARADIDQRRSPKSRMEANCSSHWVVIFLDNKTRIFHAYDARDPVLCLDSIQNKHPDYEYVTCKGMPTGGAATEWAKSFRLVADLTPELLTMFEAGRAATHAQLIKPYGAATLPTADH